MSTRALFARMALGFELEDLDDAIRAANHAVTSTYINHGLSVDSLTWDPPSGNVTHGVLYVGSERLDDFDEAEEPVPDSPDLPWVPPKR